MIWIDITDPKYALFFNAMKEELAKLDSLLITTRRSENYSECADLLDKFNMNAIVVGGYGGESKIDKFKARMNRQNEFLELFNIYGMPKLFISGASVEGAQTAFGLGIPIVHFSDTPIAGHINKTQNLTLLSRLTLPLSSLVFIPFVLHKNIYKSFGLDSRQIKVYDFIDVALWLESIKMDSNIESKNPLKSMFKENLPLVLAREEEFKAHYVKAKFSLFYESVNELSKSANILIMPRYEKEHLKIEFGNNPRIKILESKLFVNEFYPYIDLLLGGGGTMNLEAAYLGIPVISTRSLLLYHDKFLIKNNLMKYARNLDSLKKHFRFYESISFRKNPESRKILAPNGVSLEHIIDSIKQLFNN